MYIMTSLLFIPLNNTWEFSIRESHHSQTCWSVNDFRDSFNHIRESHHSQTQLKSYSNSGEFNHIRESHHSQTAAL